MTPIIKVKRKGLTIKIIIDITPIKKYPKNTLARIRSGTIKALSITYHKLNKFKAKFVSLQFRKPSKFRQIQLPYPPSLRHIKTQLFYKLNKIKIHTKSLIFTLKTFKSSLATRKSRLKITIRISYKTYKNIVEMSKDIPGWFIIGFMIFLMSAAYYLAQGNEKFANKLAEYAYYCLVIGVFGRLIQLIREERRQGKEREASQ